MKPPAEITASIVTYNSAPVIDACLEHLLSSTRRPLDVVVADNASRDDTLAHLQHWADRIRIIANRENLGFGRAHNAALMEAPSRYYLILNPDLELSAGALDQLVEFLEAHPSYGAVSPLLDEGGAEARGCVQKYPGHRYAGSAFLNLPGQIAVLQGACLLVRASVYREIGGFDPRFFLYAEDLDLSLEIRKHGHALHCLDEVCVKHIGGHSERSHQPRRVSAKKHFGLLLFYRKHYPSRSRAFLISRDVLKSATRLIPLAFALSDRARGRRAEHLGRLHAIARFLSGAKQL